MSEPLRFVVKSCIVLVSGKALSAGRSAVGFLSTLQPRLTQRTRRSRLGRSRYETEPGLREFVLRQAFFKAETGTDQSVHAFLTFFLYVSCSSLRDKKAQGAESQREKLRPLAAGLLALHNRVIGRRRLHGPGRRGGREGRFGLRRNPADGLFGHLPTYSVQPPEQMEKRKVSPCSM